MMISNSNTMFDMNKSYEFDEIKFVQLPDFVTNHPELYKWKEIRPNEWKIQYNDLSSQNPDTNQTTQTD